MGLGLLLFFYLPLYLTHLMKDIMPLTQSSSIVFNLVDGVIRIGIFLLYISGISMMKDIKRVFEYHGAEHKAIFTYEAKGLLENGANTDAAPRWDKPSHSHGAEHTGVLIHPAGCGVLREGPLTAGADTARGRAFL
jgi:hypothetical protein